MGVFRVTIPATELRVIRYVFSFSQIKLALYRGNNREILFVGVASVAYYEQSLPMSANHVQTLKIDVTKTVYILRGCPTLIVAPACERGFKTGDKPKIKALFNLGNFRKT